jgi:predicted phosphoadenosine phosphosulfate sulfurtransferase
MPAATSEHYRNKIATYLKWYRDHGCPELPNTAPGDTASAVDVGSWRRVCRALLKNDYWCKSLGFSPQKTSFYEQYRKIMEKRRNAWGIFSHS